MWFFHCSIGKQNILNQNGGWTTVSGRLHCTCICNSCKISWLLTSCNIHGTFYHYCAYIVLSWINYIPYKGLNENLIDKGIHYSSTGWLSQSKHPATQTVDVGGLQGSTSSCIITVWISIALFQTMATI